jgi:hypothetical protein
MRKLFNNPWFVGVLAAGALLFVGQSVVTKAFSRRPGVLQVAAAEAMAQAPAVAEPVAASAAPVTIDSVLKELSSTAAARDPFGVPAKAEAPAAAKPEQPDLVDTVHLSAIWTQGGETLVLINDTILSAGDDIGRIKVETATQDGVWLTHWKGRDFVALGGSFTLTTPARQAATL